MSPQIEFTVEWEDRLYEPPSIAIGLPESRLNEPIDIQGVGTIIILNQTSGDQHGGLWEAMLEATLGFSTGVASTIVASWLYDRIKQGKAKTLTIRRRSVVIEKEAIRLLIEEVVEETNDPDR